MGRLLGRCRALAVTLFGSGLLLFLSVWPGLLSGLALVVGFWAILWVPLALLIWAIIRLVRGRAPRSSHEGRPPVVERLAIPAVAFITLALFLTEAPRRVAFLLSRSAFERLATTARVDHPHPLPSRTLAGVYRVDEFAADRRGGVYFRVVLAPDGLGPDHLSYGFAKGPNLKGSPFGASNYLIVHVVDDWYWFRASDDSY